MQRDEYRSYRVPFYIPDEEHEFLVECETNRTAHVVQEIHTEFFVRLALMKGYAERNADENATYFFIAKQLFKPLDRLGKACSVPVDFELQPSVTDLEA